MLDAYAIRKAIPRIVVAVIAINLSIYLCVAALDITNLVAKGITQLMVAPFDTSGVTMFGVKTDKSNAIAAGGAGVFIAAGPVTAAVSALGAAGAGGSLALIGSALTAAFWLVIPVLLIVLAILATVIIRQALLFFLIVTSPIAIAMFILPGTEKYFQKWLDLFIKALLVYPIIAVIFAMSDIFGSIIFKSNNGGVVGIATIITGVAVIVAPLFLIPFAFRFAGGALGAIIGAATGVGDRVGKMGAIKGRQEYYGQKNADKWLQAKKEAYSRAGSRQETSKNGFVRAASGFQRRKISGYRRDILDREAEMNKRMQEARDNTTNFGDDLMWRAYTADLNDSRTNAETGAQEVRTAGGKWVSKAAAIEAQQKFGSRNTAAYQQGLAYEMKKANTQEEQDHLTQSVAARANAWGLSGDEANSVLIGAGFANQQKNLQWKHSSLQGTAGNLSFQTAEDKLIQEIDETPEGFASLRNGNADTVKTYAAGVVKASRELSIAKGELAPNNPAEMQNAVKNRAKNEETLRRAARTNAALKGPSGGARPPQIGEEGEQTMVPQGAQDPYAYVGYGSQGHTREALIQTSRLIDKHVAEHEIKPAIGDSRFDNASNAPHQVGPQPNTIDRGLQDRGAGDVNNPRGNNRTL